MMREKTIQEQMQLLEDVEKQAKSANIHSKKFLDELEQIKNESHISNFKMSMIEERQKLLGSCRPDYEVSPDFVSNLPELKVLIQKLAKEFGLSCEIEQDYGYSFAY